MICYKCGFDIQIEQKPGRQDICPQCGSFLHCCLNCRFYDRAAYHECREPQAEWVREKEAGNFCNYFEPGDRPGGKGSSKTDEAKRKLDDLFK